MLHYCTLQATKLIHNKQQRWDITNSRGDKSQTTGDGISQTTRWCITNNRSNTSETTGVIRHQQQGLVRHKQQGWRITNNGDFTVHHWNLHHNQQRWYVSNSRDNSLIQRKQQAYISPEISTNKRKEQCTKRNIFYSIQYITGCWKENMVSGAQTKRFKEIILYKTLLIMQAVHRIWRPVGH